MNHLLQREYGRVLDHVQWFYDNQGRQKLLLRIDGIQLLNSKDHFITTKEKDMVFPRDTVFTILLITIRRWELHSLANTDTAVDSDMIFEGAAHMVPRIHYSHSLQIDGFEPDMNGKMRMNNHYQTQRNLNNLHLKAGPQ